MTNVNIPGLARELAREYLDEPDNASADALGRRLARLARGRAILVDDQVIVPHPSGRLWVYPAWVLDDDERPDHVIAARMAALAPAAKPVVIPYDSPRRRSFVALAMEATGCTEAEADQVLADMGRVGVPCDAGEFADLARAIHRRNREREAIPDPPPLASNGGAV